MKEYNKYIDNLMENIGLDVMEVMDVMADLDKRQQALLTKVTDKFSSVYRPELYEVSRLTEEEIEFLFALEDLYQDVADLNWLKLILNKLRIYNQKRTSAERME